MNELTMFGCWAEPLDGMYEYAQVMPGGEVYVVTARCSDGCHTARTLIAPEEVPALFPLVEEKMRRAWARTHPETERTP